MFSLADSNFYYLSFFMNTGPGFRPKADGGLWELVHPVLENHPQLPSLVQPGETRHGWHPGGVIQQYSNLTALVSQWWSIGTVSRRSWVRSSTTSYLRLIKMVPDASLLSAQHIRKGLVSFSSQI